MLLRTACTRGPARERTHADSAMRLCRQDSTKYSLPSSLALSVHTTLLRTSRYGQCPPTRRQLNTRSKVSLSRGRESKSSRERTRISRRASHLRFPM